MSNWVRPGSTIGIIGGGSVARLLALSAKKLGYTVGLIDPDADCLAKSASDWFLKADLNDEKALLDFAMKSNVVIYESEIIHNDAIRKMMRAVPVPQGEEILSISQDRMLQKAFLESARVNIAPYATIVSLDDIREAINGIGFPCVLKANSADERLKDHLILYDESDIDSAEPFLKHGTCVLEAWIPADKELCLGILKDKEGRLYTYPVCELRYVRNEFNHSIAPARISDDMAKEVERIGISIAEQLDFTGVIAVELFSIESGALYVNEIVAHPHRGCHYTFNYLNFSQYDAHIKAVTGWPLRIDTSVDRAIVMQSVKQKHLQSAYTLAQVKPGWQFTFYDNRGSASTDECGHITIETDNIVDTLDTLREFVE